MGWRVYFLFIGLVATGLFLRNPINRVTVSIYLVFAVMAAIPFYFTSRRHKPPTASETAFATLWLWFRRILCFGMAPLLGAGAIAMLFDPPSPDNTFTNIALPLLTALIALFVAYVGVVGSGPRQLDWKDDIELHRENKRRYKWPW